jgi:diacylglycerol O-acyltransferase
MKLHHSLTDGVGGMELALMLFDLDPEGRDDGPMPDAPAGERLGPGRLLGDAVVDEWARAIGSMRHLAGGIVPTAAAFLRHPGRTIVDVAETARSIARTVRPVSETKSPVMTRRTLGRHLMTLDVPLDGLRRAATVVDGTVNDAFLGSVTGGLRRYHDRHGAEVGALWVTLPISIRTAEDPIGGNRITLMRFQVPVGEADPATRMRTLHQLCLRARAERSLPLTNAIAGSLNLLPSGVIGGMLKHVDVLASNVTGFSFPVYLAGAEVLGYYPFGPTIGSAVNLTLLSYRGNCCVGVTVDTGAVPDADVLADCLREGFDEVMAVAERPTVSQRGPGRRPTAAVSRAGSRPRKRAAPGARPPSRR